MAGKSCWDHNWKSILKKAPKNWRFMYSDKDRGGKRWMYQCQKCGRYQKARTQLNKWLVIHRINANKGTNRRRRRYR